MAKKSGQWLLREPAEAAESLLFCFPYGGMGASFYRRWPASIGDSRVCLLQPPGRENRMGEPSYRSFDDFTGPLIRYLQDGGYLDKPYAFIGHCGGVPLALQTVLDLADNGLPLPRRLFSSSWGAPHRGLYGPLMVVDVRSYDFVREVQEQALRAGASLPDDLASIAAGVLRSDLEALLQWGQYDASRFLPVPVTAIGWTQDETVPMRAAVTGWQEVAATAYDELAGDHLAFASCPPPLRDIVVRDSSMSRL